MPKPAYSKRAQGEIPAGVEWFEFSQLYSLSKEEHRPYPGIMGRPPGDYLYREARQAPCFDCSQRAGCQVECPVFDRYVKRAG